MKNRYWSVQLTRHPSGLDTETENLGLHIAESETKPDLMPLHLHYSKGSRFETNAGPIEEVFVTDPRSLRSKEPLIDSEGLKIWRIRDGDNP